MCDLMMSFYVKKDAIILVSFILVGLTTLQYYSRNMPEVNKYIRNKKCWIKIFHFFIIFSLGVILNQFKVFQETEKIIGVFSTLVLVFISLLIFFSIQFIYCKTKNVAITFLKYIICYIYVFLFVCGLYYRNINNLSIGKLIIFLMLISFFLEISIILLEKNIEEENDSENDLLDTDYPNVELFEKREKQLTYFAALLKELYKEPYAIMINAKWGVGKTSFVMALEKKLKDSIFLWIEIGNEKDVKQIMNEISLKVIDVLDSNDIYVENDRLIKKYFLAFSSYIGENNLNFFDFLINEFTSNVDVYSKEFIDKKLKELDKTIYLVIDDIDRCSEEHRNKTFKILRECTNLNNCKTIFLADKSYLHFDDEYLEKYINYTLDLCEVEFEDIIEYYFEKIIVREIRVTIKKIFQDLYYINKDIVYKIKNNIVDNLKNKIDSSARLTKEEITELKSTLNELYINIKNVRKVKRFLKSVNIFIKGFINSEISNLSIRFNKVNWIECMIRVNFIKAFLPQLYNNLLMVGSVEENILTYNNMSSIELILKGINDDNYLGIYYMNTYSDLIFENDVYYDQTKRAKYLKQLREGKGVLQNVIHYITYYENKDDIYKIIDFCIDNMYDENNNDIILDYILNIVFYLDISLKEKTDLLLKCLEWFESTSLHKNESPLRIVESYNTNEITEILVDNLSYLNDIFLCIFNEKITNKDLIDNDLKGFDLAVKELTMKDTNSDFENNITSHAVFVEKVLKFDQKFDQKDSTKSTILRENFGTDLSYLKEKFKEDYLKRPECYNITEESREKIIHILEFLNIWVELESVVKSKIEDLIVTKSDIEDLIVTKSELENLIVEKVEMADLIK